MAILGELKQVFGLGLTACAYSVPDNLVFSKLLGKPL